MLAGPGTCLFFEQKIGTAFKVEHICPRHCALLNKNNDNALSLFFKKVMNNAISLIMQEKVMHYH